MKERKQKKQGYRWPGGCGEVKGQDVLDILSKYYFILF